MKVAASQLASLLGHFGPHQQYSKLVSLIPELKTSTYVPQPNFIDDAKLQSEWQELLLRADMCVYQEELCELFNDTFQTLFWGPYICARIDAEPAEPRIASTLRNVDAYQQHFDDLLTTLNPEGILYPALKAAHQCFRQLKGRASKTYGIRGEAAIHNIYNKVHEKPIIKTNKLLSKSFGPYKLTGIIDGTVDGIVLEIKHRTKLIYSTIPLYELLQLHVYMYLTDSKTCRLLQCVRQSQSYYVEAHTVHFDPELWNEVERSLSRIHDLAQQLQNNPFSRECFEALDLDKKLALIKKYC